MGAPAATITSSTRSHQKDFYRLYAFFNNIDELGGEVSVEQKNQRKLDPMLEFGKPEEFARREAIRQQQSILDKELKAYQVKLEETQDNWEEGLPREERASIAPQVRESLEIPPERRKIYQRRVLDLFFFAQDPAWQAPPGGAASPSRGRTHTRCGPDHAGVARAAHRLHPPRRRLYPERRDGSPRALPPFFRDRETAGTSTASIWRAGWCHRTIR